MVEYSRLTPEVRDQLQQVITEVAPRFDRVLLDTGAGISDVVLYTVSLADRVLVVATPEPTSLTDAYATIKVLAMTQQRFNVQLVVNQVRKQGDGRAVRQQLQQVIDRYVSPTLPQPVKLELVGEVPLDTAVREAVLKRELIMNTAPGSPAGVALSALGLRLRSL
jgi:flagellar biosynthesis protein FlhG